jgi:hypothetical protein
VITERGRDVFTNDTWGIIILGYLVLIALTFLPVVRQNLKSVGSQSLTIEPDKLESQMLSEKGLAQVKANFVRLAGSLKFWKKQAAQNKQFHYYVMLWTTVAAPLIPILTQEISDFRPNAKVMLTIVSIHSAILLAFHRLLKPDKAFAAFRKAESNYYDLMRDMLDRPEVMGGKTEAENMSLYLEKVRKLREEARGLEIAEYFPSIESSTTAFTAAAQTAGMNIQFVDSSPGSGSSGAAGTQAGASGSQGGAAGSQAGAAGGAGAAGQNNPSSKPNTATTDDQQGSG